MSDLTLTVQLVGDQAVIARMERMPAQIQLALTRKITRLAIDLETKVKRDKLSGQVLNVRTGRLRRSIFHEVTATEHSVIAKVASSGDVRYAGIHEFGGKTPAHVIEPKKAKALAFMMGGKQVFAARVNHPGSKMPERSFLRSSLGDMKGEITTGMRQALRQGVGLE